MNNKLNNILEEFDSFSLEEQETILEIEKKKSNWKKERTIGKGCQRSWTGISKRNIKKGECWRYNERDWWN